MTALDLPAEKDESSGPVKGIFQDFGGDRQRRGRIEMRGNSSRLLCSPYFVSASLLMLVFITARYWTMSSQNSELSYRLDRVQTRLEKEIASLKDLELSVQEKNDGLQNCEQQKMNLESDLDKKESEIASLTKASGDKATLAKEKAQCDELVSNLRKEVARLRDDNEVMTKELKSLEKDGNQLAAKETELQALKMKMAELKAEMSSLKEQEKVSIPQHPAKDEDQTKELGPGQLPDVDPESVHVVRKEVIGMSGHTDESGRYLPILPQQPPDTPRKSPRFSVVDRPGNETSDNDQGPKVNPTDFDKAWTETDQPSETVADGGKADRNKSESVKDHVLVQPDVGQKKEKVPYENEVSKEEPDLGPKKPKSPSNNDDHEGGDAKDAVLVEPDLGPKKPKMPYDNEVSGEKRDHDKDVLAEPPLIADIKKESGKGQKEDARQSLDAWMSDDDREKEDWDLQNGFNNDDQDPNGVLNDDHEEGDLVDKLKANILNRKQAQSLENDDVGEDE